MAFGKSGAGLYKTGGGGGADATAVLKNTDGTTLSTTNIPSGTSDDITAPDSTFSINGTQVATIPSGDSDSIQVRKESGSNQIGSLQGQYWRVDDSVITLKDTANNTLSTTNVPATEAQDITAPDADVENSDASYTDTIESGGTLVVPDSDVNVNSSLEGTVVSVKDIDIDVTDGSSPVTPDAVSVVGNTVTIQVPAAGGAPVGATLMKTGQTTSYRTGDDGDLEAGRATDFYTLASNNPFGNTDRFTDELGGSTYTNDIVIDWSTYDGSTVLGWRRTLTSTVNWNTAIDGALAVSIGTFTSGWRLPNFQEMSSLYNAEDNTFGNSAPAPWTSILPSGYLWTSTTSFGSTGLALVFRVQFPDFPRLSKTTSSGTNYMPVRTFTVTGTTLS